MPNWTSCLPTAKTIALKTGDVIVYPNPDDGGERFRMRKVSPMHIRSPVTTWAGTSNLKTTSQNSEPTAHAVRAANHGVPSRLRPCGDASPGPLCVFGSQAAIYRQIPWHPIIVRGVDAEAQSIGLGSRVTLGVHLRLGDKPKSAGPTELLAKDICRFMARQALFEDVVIVSDNSTEKARLATLVRNCVRDTVSVHASTVKLLDRGSAAGVRAAAADWQLVTRCTFVMFNAASSFGYEAAVAGTHDNHMLGAVERAVVGNKTTDRNRRFLDKYGLNLRNPPHSDRFIDTRLDFFDGTFDGEAVSWPGSMRGPVCFGPGDNADCPDVPIYNATSRVKTAPKGGRTRRAWTQ